MKKLINKIKYWLRAFQYNCSFLGVLNSPFKKLKLHWYFGEIKIGHPYFLPSRLCKSKTKPGYMKFVPIKYFGITWNTLGWKTKWGDYRFEWNPGISLVIFGKQLHVSIRPDTDADYWDSYWEAWLNYNYKTDKNRSKLFRLKQLFDIYDCTWTHYDDNNKEVLVNHYHLILKNKYLSML